MKKLVGSLLVLSGVFVWACSGSTTITDPAADGGTGGDATTTNGDAGAEYCAAINARAKKCADSPAADCSKDAACWESQFRPGVASTLEACLTGRACSTGDDDCFIQAAAPYAGAAAVTAYVAACNDKRSQCSTGDAGTFNDDYCSTAVGSYNDTLIGALQSCFSMDCSAIVDCFDQKTAAVGCGN